MLFLALDKAAAVYFDIVLKYNKIVYINNRKINIYIFYIIHITLIYIFYL